MARPKRQRPSWLPSWIPFKDGRYLGLARQTLLAWISAILALSFFSMTVAYAKEESRFSKVKFVHSSRSNTILVLRVLSEAAGVFLAGTVYSTFEVIQWVLLSRPEGIRLPQFLALQASTGPLGLLVLALGKGLPASQWPMKPRLMSLIRLTAEAAIPALGVIIMSNVNTNVVYLPKPGTVQPMAFGMTPFNGSVASQLGVMEDLMFNIDYVTFLSSPLHAIDITPDAERKNGCIQGWGLTPNDSCSRQVLITQEYQNVEANLPLTQQWESQVVLSLSQQIYSLEYRDNLEVPKENLRCADFSSGPAHYRLCMRNTEDGLLQAVLLPCPESLIIRAQCMQDTSWRSAKGFTTSLRTSFLDASVSYERMDGRIISHEVHTGERSAGVNSSEVLDAITILLNTTAIPINTTAANPILGSPTHFFGRLFAAHMYRVTKLLNTNPEAHAKGTNALQSLLGITLFYCQNGILGQAVLPFASNATAAKENYSKGAYEKQAKSSFVALGETRYKIEVGRTTLLAYIVLGGVTLFICIVALLVGSLLELVKFDAEPTLWPSLDFYTQCRVEDQNGKIVSAHRRIELAWIYNGRELFKEIESLRVRRRKRQLRPLEEPGVTRADDG